MDFAIRPWALRLGAIAFASFAACAHAAVSDDRLWQDVAERGVAATGARQIVPDDYRTVRLDRARFADLLERAPAEAQRRAADSDVEFALPMPDGTFARFRIAESPVMEPELAKKYPQIRTWVGQGIDDRTATLRFDLTHKGFHAQVLSASGTVMIDPFQQGDLDTYIAYDKKAHRHGEPIRCSVSGEDISKESSNEHRAHTKVSAGDTLRTYRFAMAATGEYTAFHGGQKADALAGIVTTMNRVNGIYEREIGVRMVLIGDTDKVIYTNANTDPYNNDDADLDIQPGNLDAVIGTANYDVGHLVGTGGGGVAFLGVICTSSKGGGLTGSPSPVGDAFDVDYVAHEIGHQFGGSHTFNGGGGSCAGGNRSAAAAYEPGSGVTIQAYAGICGADNLQPNSEDFFHRKSLDQLIEHTTTGSGGTCGTVTATNNVIPTVSTAPGYAIPASTPFELEAVGVAGDTDELTYSWEQYDLGNRNGTGVLADDGSRPLFRPYTPSSSPVRSFPSLRFILDNANVPPQTSPLPGTATTVFTGELLPSTDRTMTFRVTVRDNRAGGGGTNDASTSINVEPGTPFAITAPNTAVSWPAGTSQTVTWNAGSTTSAPISAANVRITLSLDGGYTFPIELAASVPNNGSATVAIPPGTPATTQARIKVKAVGNVFFDISNANFAITGGNLAPVVTPGPSLSIRQGGPQVSGIVGSVSDNAAAAGSLAVVASGAPPELEVAVTNVGGSLQLAARAECTLVAPTSGNKTYPVRITATDSQGAVGAADVNVLVATNRAPTLGTYTGSTLARPGVSNYSPSAGPADPDGNYDSLSVSPTVLDGGGTVSVNAAGNVTFTATATTRIGAHVIRVQAIDDCGAAEIREFTVNVISTTPALGLVSAGVLGGNGLLEPNECNQLSLTLENLGSVAATNVSATLSSSDPSVTIVQAVSPLPDIAPNGQSTTSLPFQVSTSAGLTCLSAIDFDVAVTYTGGGSPFLGEFSLTAGQPAAQNYVFAGSTGNTLPIDPANVRIAGSNVDDGAVAVVPPSGFNFTLYGQPMTPATPITATTNGSLQFTDVASATLNYTNGPLPSSGGGDYPSGFPANSPVLLPYYDDLTLAGNGGGIYTQVIGSAPNRQWIIEWRGQQWVSNPSTINTRFAVVFHEGQDGFDFLYLQTGNAASAAIGVQAATSGTQFTQYATSISNIPAGTRLAARRAPAVCNAGGGACNSGPGVQVTPSGGTNAVTEGGATDSYTIQLTTPPSANVTITPTGNVDATAAPATLTFTPANWSVPQAVTVTAVNDRIVEGAHAASITHVASGGGYDAVSIAPAAITITDNDAATYRFTAATSSAAEGAGTLQIATALDFVGTGTGTPSLEAPINVPVSVGGASTATGGGVDYTLNTALIAIAADGSAAPVSITLAASAVAEPSETVVLQLGDETGGTAAQQLAVSTGTPATHTLTITDANTAGVTLVESAGDTLVAEGGATDTYTLVLTSQPTADVTITIAAGVELSAAPTALVFTAANWNVPQTVTVTAVDDADNEGPHAGTIQHTAAGGGYNTVIVPSLTVDIADNYVSVDFAVSALRSEGPVVPNGTVSFEVDAVNLSATSDASGTLSFAVLPALTDVTWTCVADAGATCPANGNGNPANVAIALPRNTGATFTVTGTIPAGATPGTVYTGTATVTVTAPAIDGNAANNSATATATVDGNAIFANGFE